ncbi:hypothetical protein AGABI1DRAFT_134462 [Agaricus bisporus var. burnettii JB137-S8]|uniref:Uncharacterized protein n=1 Tax=Agaricus bisporus var. burnettii (strain JB137-S8 / ATCC MYA-4627 / FGSC 10392) TaxID=597362 RepID=K5WEC6_AGABU|nr:uncharacterized protein AGABI1DRAFT_134462 [Agaricus bisporus var. burnettii JB137-S8]EKM73581.1 hypothetical protein AGABI1DRAFT_134462 [Agaricus bisporus var. burnettii JB137-S8]
MLDVRGLGPYDVWHLTSLYKTKGQARRSPLPALVPRRRNYSLRSPPNHYQFRHPKEGLYLFPHRANPRFLITALATQQSGLPFLHTLQWVPGMPQCRFRESFYTGGVLP